MVKDILIEHQWICAGEKGSPRAQYKTIQSSIIINITQNKAKVKEGTREKKKLKKECNH